MRKIVRNDVVSMDWDAEGFFESRTQGFVSAVHVYKTPKGDVPVIFEDKKAYLLIDPDTQNPAPFEDVANVIKDCFKAGVDVEGSFEDAYVELGVVVVSEEETAYEYGLSSEDIKDINNRLDDLSGYWAVVEESMV